MRDSLPSAKPVEPENVLFTSSGRIIGHRTWCWPFFHYWDRWEEIVLAYMQQGRETIFGNAQKRVCRQCGKVQRRDL